MGGIDKVRKLENMKENKILEFPPSILLQTKKNKKKVRVGAGEMDKENLKIGVQGWVIFN